MRRVKSSMSSPVGVVSADGSTAGDLGRWRSGRSEEEDEEVDAGYQVDGEESGEEEEDEEGGGVRSRGGRGDAELSGNRSWIVFIVVFVFQLLVPSILWSYGVLMVRLIENNEIQLHVILWTPALFSAAFCLADPWFRWPATRGSAGKRSNVTAPWVLRPLAVGGVLLTALSLAATPFFPTRNYFLLTYGVLAGVGSSMAIVQSELALDQRFPPRRRSHTRRALALTTIRVAAAISQITSPLIILAIVNAFGRRYAPMLQSGIVLQALVAAFLLRYRKMEATPSKPRSGVRLKDMRYSLMEEDEGADTETGWHCGPLSTAAPEGENLLPFEEDMGGRSWKNPARDDTTVFDPRDDDDDDLSPNEPIETLYPDCINSLLQQPRKKNRYGVEILPQILEETEDDESFEGHPSKRSSRRLTIEIPGLNNNNNNSNGKNQLPMSESPTSQNSACFQNGNNYYPDTPTSTSSTTFLISPNGGLRKWKRWKWKRRKWRKRNRRGNSRSSGRGAEEDEEDEEDTETERGKKNCCASLVEVVDFRGMRKASFYPALALSVSTRLSAMVFFTFLPLLAKRLGRSNNDSTLLVCIAGFSSLIMSASSPWISHPSQKTKVLGLFAPRCCRKFMYCFGSFVSAGAFFLLSRSEWYDRLTMSAILFGIGSGATADTPSSLLRVACGGNCENVDGSRGLMCTLTAFFILGFTALLGAYTDSGSLESPPGSYSPTLPGVGSLSVCFSILAIVQFLAGITWFIQPVLSRFYRRQRHYADWNPGMFLQAT